MKLDQLTEARYANAIDAEPILAELIERYNQATGEEIPVNKINDKPLSKKRAEVIARYTVRIIVPETLDEAGFAEEAQKLRNLPSDVDMQTAADVIPAVNTIPAVHAAAHTNAARASNAAYAATRAAGAVRARVHAAANAAYAAKSTNRYVYHLNQMIKHCMEIQ